MYKQFISYYLFLRLLFQKTTHNKCQDSILRLAAINIMIHILALLVVFDFVFSINTTSWLFCSSVPAALVIVPISMAAFCLLSVYTKSQKSITNKRKGVKYFKESDFDNRAWAWFHIIFTIILSVIVIFYLGNRNIVMVE